QPARTEMARISIGPKPTEFGSVTRGKIFGWRGRFGARARFAWRPSFLDLNQIDRPANGHWLNVIVLE
ncbi:MAG: hypothetical protein ACLP8B_08435, partial [Xanthobacteraceae bacterium]